MIAALLMPLMPFAAPTLVRWTAPRPRAAASRVRVGAHHPHDVLIGFAVGALVALLATGAVRREQSALATRLKAGAPRPLPAAA